MKLTIGIDADLAKRIVQDVQSCVEDGHTAYWSDDPAHSKNITNAEIFAAAVSFLLERIADGHGAECIDAAMGDCIYQLATLGEIKYG